jgi:hypothetical protein
MTDRVGASAHGPREGYPVIEDRSSALWAAQEAGWPDHLPHEAWAAVVAAAPVGGFSSSATHPAFDESYVGNAYASQPSGEPPKLAPTPAAKARR